MRLLNPGKEHEVMTFPAGPRNGLISCYNEFAPLQPSLKRLFLVDLRSFHAVVVSLSVACAAVPALAQDAAPPAAITAAAPDAAVPDAGAATQNTVVTAANPPQYTLGTGSDDGAQRGAIYGVVQDGKTRIRLQITELGRTDSTARLLDKQEDFLLAVGDAVQLLGVETLPEAPATLPAAPTMPATPIEPSAPLSPTTPIDNGTMTPQSPSSDAGFEPISPATPSATTVSMPAPASITALDGATATFNAGTARGVQTGDNLSILRGKSVIGVLRVQTATDDTSTGTVVWRDENMAAIAVGDAVGVMSMPAAADPDFALGNNTEKPVVSTPIRYETGASNAVVPRTDYTYELLAALASAQLITRYPANIFHDEGTRHHRTGEDMTFTRAQIADLIREALESEKAAEAGSRIRVALRILVRDYARELQQLGVTAETLAPFSAGRGFQFGVSGQQRLSLVGGDTRDVLLPFSERQGGLRTRSGYDSRTNIFATSGNRLTFRSTIDGGSQANRDNREKSFEVRRALLSYDAGKLLRGLTIEAGRDERWWGPGHFGTLLLSDVAGPMSMISAKFKRGSYEFESLYAPLGRGVQGGSRSFYGQKLELKIGSQSRIGFANSVIDPSNSIDPVLFASTFSPIPLITAQRIKGGGIGKEEQNILFQGYLETSLARGSQLYGEVLVDDIGFDNQNNTRNRIGTIVGAHLFTPKDPTRLGTYIEYANLQFRTYLDLGQGPDYTYYYRGRPLGYPVAPFGGGAGGAESLRGEIYWRPTRKLRLTFGAEFADLNSEQPVITRQQTYRFSAAYNLSRAYTLTARAQSVSTTQPNFIRFEPPVSQKLLQLEISRAF